MKIYVVVQEQDEGSLILAADMDEHTAEMELTYHESISHKRVRLAEIELTNKRLSID